VGCVQDSGVVEFVVGEDDDNRDGDYEVAVEDGAPSGHRPGTRGLVVAAAVVAVGAALIARSTAGPQHAVSRPADPSPALSPTLAPTLHPKFRPAGCPPGATCDIVRTVPASTVSAVRAAFPKAQLRSALSVVTRQGAEFGSPLVLRRVAFTFGATNLSIAMTQRRCGDTEPGDQVTQQNVGRMRSTLLVKAVPGDVEGDIRLNKAGHGDEDAYCFLDSILVEQPRGAVTTVDLDRLAVDEALRSTG
jgi:hypothetical protein